LGFLEDGHCLWFRTDIFRPGMRELVDAAEENWVFGLAGAERFRSPTLLTFFVLIQGG